MVPDLISKIGAWNPKEEHEIASIFNKDCFQSPATCIIGSAPSLISTQLVGGVSVTINQLPIVFLHG